MARRPSPYLQPLQFNVFSGLDTRPGRFGEDNPSLVVGSNISLVPGGALTTRPALVKVCDLHAESLGLYARGGRLRAVVPGGRSIQDSHPSALTYDPIGNGVAYPLGKLQRLIGVDTFGTSGIYGPHAYVAVQRSDLLTVEHHWIKEPPATSVTPVNTQVVLPFQPGPALLKIEQKMCAPAPRDGTVAFSSTQFGPINWTNLGDAGFLPVADKLSGARDVLTLNTFRGRMAVFFRDAVQLWDMSVDPTKMRLAQTLNGPGALLAGAVANVSGDVYFLGPGGFRSLGTATVTQEADADDIGAPIQTLTKPIPDTAHAVALWSESRSQFLCAIGGRVFALTVAPLEKLKGWTTWDLPVAVDYLVELDRVLYARSGNILYRFDDTLDTDDGGARIAWNIRTRDLAFHVPTLTKTLQYLTIRQTAPAQWRQIVDGLPFPWKRVPACSPKPLQVGISGEGKQVALEASGTGRWRLEGLALEAEAQYR